MFVLVVEPDRSPDFVAQSFRRARHSRRSPRRVFRGSKNCEPFQRIRHTASIAKSDDGHYWAEAAVNGEEVRFLVDTGASAVALTPDDALRLGFDPKTLNYAFTVTTASGQARAAEVKLNTVAVAGAEVDNVDAYVIESGLKQSLLGMTYLGRLSQFEATKSALILRP